MIIRDESGFTLIELLVVVAIIGILSTVAVPMYKKSQVRARQSEAKVALSYAFQSEQSYILSGSTGLATSCLGNIGVQSPTGGTYYALGVSSADVTMPGGTDCTAGSGTSPNGQGYNATAYVEPASTAANYSNLPSGTSLKSGGNANFTFGTAGFISTTTADTWTIDQSQNLTNVTIGI